MGNRSAFQLQDSLKNHNVTWSSLSNNLEFCQNKQVNDQCKLIKLILHNSKTVRAITVININTLVGFTGPPDRQQILSELKSYKDPVDLIFRS